MGNKEFTLYLLSFFCIYNHVHIVSSKNKEFIYLNKSRPLLNNPPPQPLVFTGTSSPARPSPARSPGPSALREGAEGSTATLEKRYFTDEEPRFRRIALVSDFDYTRI